MSSYWSRFDGHNNNNGAQNNDRPERWITTVPRPLYQQMDVDGELQPWRLFEERVRTGPFGLSRFPLQPFSPVRILILNGGSASGSSSTNSRSNSSDMSINPRLRRFIQNSPPRIQSEWNVWTPTSAELPEYEEPGLTDGEFKTAMKRLKRKVYQPSKKPQRRGLFGSTKYKSMRNEVDVEIIGELGNKECTICLEAFVPNEHVLLTPCKHTFHDGCITPWVKSHGKCPICRFAFCERSQSASSTSMIPNYSNNNNNWDVSNVRGAVLTGEEELALELVALIRAMEEAFNWVNLNSRSVSFE